MPKTIDIDDDAYDRLDQARLGEESVSEVIRRYVKPIISAEDVIDLLQKSALSDDTIDAIDESVSRRRTSRRRGA